MSQNCQSKKILVIGSPSWDGGYASFVQAANVGKVTFDVSNFKLNPDEYSLVHFTGGEDVSPELYGETSPKNMCGSNRARDDYELKIFQIALKKNIPMYGICRGAQFLNVMLGGKMVHHLGGHGGVHHDIILNTESIVPNRLSVTSTHHQMMIPTTATRVLAWAAENRSEFYYGDRDEKMDWMGPEIESIYQPLYNVLGVQWHPEMMSSESPGYVFSLKMLQDFVTMETYEFTAKYNPTQKDIFIRLKRS